MAQNVNKGKLTYYDSLIMGLVNTNTGKAPVSKEKKQQPKPVEATKKSSGDEIERYFETSSADNLPAKMWYGRSFAQNQVRPKVLPLDSLPDEINIRLVKNDNEFCFPIKSIRTSPYGWRWNRPHRGVDIALKIGDPIHAAFPGVVRVATVMGGYGNVIVIRHYNGLETVYGHLSKIQVKPRQEVKAGDVIGLGGNTGHSTGPHLHFEVRFQYEAFDPEWILDFSSYSLRTHRLHLDKTYFGITAPRGKNAELAYKADKSYVKENPLRENNPNAPRYYTTYSGDTFERVAGFYRITVEELYRLNPDVPRKKLKAGTKLRVK